MSTGENLDFSAKLKAAEAVPLDDSSTPELIADEVSPQEDVVSADSLEEVLPPRALRALRMPAGSILVAPSVVPPLRRLN